MRGCVFVEKFDSVDDAVKNGMTIGGGVPTFTPGAVTFDGASYLTYPSGNSSIRGAGSWTIMCKMTPRAITYSMAAAFGSVVVGKLPWIGIGATGFFSAGTYGPAVYSTVVPQIGVEKHICATYNGTTITLYVDGISLSWSGLATVDIVSSNVYIGGVIGYYTTSTVKDVRIFSQCFSPEEVLQYVTNQVYAYRNRASLYLSMRNVDHQALQTLDTSGNNRHGVFSAVVPTKLQRHGYDLNGASQYFTVSTVGLPLGGVAGANTGVTFAVEFEADFAGDDGVGYDLIDSTDGSAWPQPTRHIVQKDALNRLTVFIAGTNLTPVAFASFAPYWYRTGRNVIVASCKSGKSNLWLNGGRLLADDATVIGAAVQTSLYVGASPFPSAFFNGRITRVGVWGDLALTTVQIFDLLALWQKTASEA